MNVLIEHPGLTWALSDSAGCVALKHTWHLCWQVLRVFVLARVTVKSLKSLPGMEACQLPPDSALQNSNVYSTAEAVLLAWMTAHYYKVRSPM